MRQTKRSALEAAGWRVSDADTFLGLSAEEAAFVELKLCLSAALRTRRLRLRLSQHMAAERLKSSQSRVAKMEAGDASVSLDLLVRALLGLGATPNDIARAMQRSRERVRRSA